MNSNLSVGATHPSPTPPAERTERTRPFDGWLPEPADITMDPIDHVVGRAFADLTFRAELLANPLATLAAEPMMLDLKRLLGGIRATSVEDFARQAYRARIRSAQLTPWRDSDVTSAMAPPSRVGSFACVGV